MSVLPKTWSTREELANLLEERHEQRIHTLAEVNQVVDDIVAKIEQRGRTSKDVFAIRLILEEGLVNALVHGNRGDTSKWAMLRCCFFRDHLLIEIEDQGEGFDPQQVPDPLAPENLGRTSGRGLLLMRRYSTWMCFNERGNRVTMGRVCSDGDCNNHVSPDDALLVQP